ncbi:MAG: HAD family hydrolase [Pseudomonadota bacterium]
MSPVNDSCLRVAMWSGPRNISTAMMRSFENRSDCEVVDEPFYAAYLVKTGLEHPGSHEIVASQPTTWQAVADRLITEHPAPVYFQKHMTQHLLPGMDLSFTKQLSNCFLIRDPARIILSYARVRPTFSLEELGIPQQVALFDAECERLGEPPPVLDAALTLANPECVLRKLCWKLGIHFEERMLRWPAGPRDSDGVWSPYWYSRVLKSTGFEATLSSSSDYAGDETASRKLAQREVRSSDYGTPSDKALDQQPGYQSDNQSDNQFTNASGKEPARASQNEKPSTPSKPVKELDGEQLEMCALAERSYERLRRFAIDGGSV